MAKAPCLHFAGDGDGDGGKKGKKGKKGHGND